MSKYPQNTMHVKIMYGLTNRGRCGQRTFAPVDLTAPKVAVGNKKEEPMHSDKVKTSWIKI